MNTNDTSDTIIETEEENKKYEELFEQLDSILKEEELDDLPFSVSLFDIGDDIRKELNEPFTDKDVIIIKDTRNQFWDENALPHYLSIHKRGNPITLKQILMEMGNDIHYKNIETDHRFLEFFDTNNDIQYEPFFGS